MIYDKIYYKKNKNQKIYRKIDENFFNLIMEYFENKDLGYMNVAFGNLKKFINEDFNVDVGFLEIKPIFKNISRRYVCFELKCIDYNYFNRMKEKIELKKLLNSGKKEKRSRL